MKIELNKPQVARCLDGVRRLLPAHQMHDVPEDQAKMLQARGVVKPETAQPEVPEVGTTPEAAPEAPEPATTAPGAPKPTGKKRTPKTGESA